MIIGNDFRGFLKKYLSKGGQQAFLLEGVAEESEDLFIKYLGGDAENIFDIKRFEEDILKIENAREIQFGASLSSFSGSPKVFIIKSRYVADDAQAPLLK